MTGVIRGTGSYVPSYVIDNDRLSEFVDTSDAWIQERTGVKRRHIVVEETTTSMAAEAAKRALDSAGMDPGEIDLILVSTISSEVILPCAACEVQRQIGAVHATCFDLSAACTGFVLAYNTANAYLASGIYKNALIIGSECLSNLTNWRDRSTCILFGDGAGAAVLQAAGAPEYLPATHSDGQAGDALRLKSRHDCNGITRPIKEEKMTGDDYFMQMDGQAVFRFAVKKVPEVIQEVLTCNQMDTEDVTWYLLHQANRRIVEAVAKRLEEPIEKFPMNLMEYGNTSSASIPILLDELNRGKKLRAGDRIVIAGFGAGLTWGASILEWQ